MQDYWANNYWFRSTEVSTKAQKKIVNLYADRGATFTKTLNVYQEDGRTLKNLSGYSISSNIRGSFAQPEYFVIIAEITDSVTGEVRLSISSTSTRNIPAGKYFYDVLIEENSGSSSSSSSESEEPVVEKIFEGYLFMNDTATA